MVRFSVWGVGLALGVCLWGCGAMPLTASLWSVAERREEASRYLNQAVHALNEVDLDRADRLLELAILLQDDETAGVVPVAQRLLEEVKPNNAVSLLERAIQQPATANNPLVYGVLSHAYTMLDTRDNAERSQKHAEELVRSAEELVGKSVPENEAERQGRVRQLFSAGRYCAEYGEALDKAVALLRGAVDLSDPARLSSGDAQARSYLGVTLALHPKKALDRGEAAHLTLQAAQLDPQNPNLLHAYGISLLQQEDFAGAQRVLREATDLDPNNAELRCHLGQTYARRNLFAQAALELDRALLLRPKLTEALRERAKLPVPLPSTLASTSEEDLY